MGQHWRQLGSLWLNWGSDTGLFPSSPQGGFLSPFPPQVPLEPSSKLAFSERAGSDGPENLFPTFSPERTSLRFSPTVVACVNSSALPSELSPSYFSDPATLLLVLLCDFHTALRFLSFLFPSCLSSSFHVPSAPTRGSAEQKV